jgi:hypothetical protein
MCTVVLDRDAFSLNGKINPTNESALRIECFTLHRHGNTRTEQVRAHDRPGCVSRG